MPTHYAGNTTRPHWGGANSDQDQHLEEYDGIRDGAFEYESQFIHLSTQRNTNGSSNNYRFDRLNKSRVKGRGVGDDIESQRVTSDKVNIIVSVMMYIRNPIDYLDDWTSPDYLNDIGKDNGSEFAHAFDEAHIIRLQKARNWTAPAHLKPAFNDGLSITTELKAGGGLTSAELAANAEAMYVAIGALVTELIERKTPMGSMVCLITPSRFSELLNHPKLINKDFTSDNGDFANRRMLNVHGISLIESTAFPKSTTPNHILSSPENGNAFDATAEDIKCEIIVFDRQKSLITVTAKPFHSTFWDDKKDMTYVLDCMSMWTVDIRRPDTIGVVMINEV